MSDGAPAPTPIQAPAQTNTDTGEQPQSEQPQQTVDDEIDFGDYKVKKSVAKERLNKQRELERGSYQRFEEASKIRKEAEALFSAIKGDTRKALANVGLSREQLVQLAEQILTDEVAEATMSPQERRARELERENTTLKQQREEEERRRTAAAQHQEVQQWEQRFDRAFQDVITRKGLNADADTIFKLAAKVEAYWGNGMDVSLDDIADEIAEEEEAIWGKRLESWDDATFAKRLGAKGKERARKLLLEEVRNTQQVNQPQQRQIQQKNSAASPKKLTRAEFEARIAKRMGQ